jgi:uncharacterized protein YbbK (DUF523 family)
MEQKSLISSKTDQEERPAVLVAACLCGIACRYHGELTPPRTKLLERLAQKFRLVLVCPEQLGGLPTPRPPARWKADRLWAAGQDVTEAFERGARLALNEAEEAGALAFYGLRHSPSCDPKNGITARLFAQKGIACRFG